MVLAFTGAEQQPERAARHRTSSGRAVNTYRSRSHRTSFGTDQHPGGGTGIGLPTALAIAQAHGGTIEVESEVGRGSTFHLVVPRGDVR